MQQLALFNKLLSSPLAINAQKMRIKNVLAFHRTKDTIKVKGNCFLTSRTSKSSSSSRNQIKTIKVKNP